MRIKKIKDLRRNFMKVMLVSSFLMMIAVLGGCAQIKTPQIKTSQVYSNSAYSVDFSKPVQKIVMNYGMNENDDWPDFVDLDEIKELHRGIKSEYIRIWLSDEEWIEKTIPFTDEWDYDFTEADRLIDATLESGAIPFVTFAQAPNTMTSEPGDPPWEIRFFSDYVKEVVKHFRNKCDSDTYSLSCDVNDWYFEIWNEPWKDEWWESDPPLYSQLFNAANEEIKTVAPNAKVGGFVLPYYDKYQQHLDLFLRNSRPDFVSVHAYGNIQSEKMDEAEKMKAAKFLLYDSIIDLDDELRRRNRNIEIINSEYSSDYTSEYMEHLDENMTTAWYASALIYQLKGGIIDIELFYAGTTKFPGTGFGMWSDDGGLDIWPIYYMKKNFVEINTFGSQIYESKSSDDVVILAVSNDKGEYVTAVNTLNHEKIIDLCIKNSEKKTLVDISTKEEYKLDNCIAKLTLKPYEVKFLQLS